MKTLAITLTRGGSTGIPGKNLATVAGRPLLYYAMQAGTLAVARGTVDKYVLGTDSADIAQMARLFNRQIEIVMLPEELTEPGAESFGSLQYVLNQKNAGHEQTVELMATNPCYTADDVEKVVGLLDVAPAAVAVSPLGTKVERLKLVQGGSLHDICAHWFEEPGEVRQQMTRAYVRCSAIYAWRTSTLWERGRRFGIPYTVPYVIETPGFYGIDEAQDVALAEYWIAERRKR